MKNGKYQKRDIVALRKSIKHWEKDNVGKKKYEDTKIDANDCALCVLYNPSFLIIDDCEGCPVKYATGIGYCKASPYEGVEQLVSQWGVEAKKPKGFERAVAAEIAFLKKLLREAKQKYAA